MIATSNEYDNLILSDRKFKLSATITLSDSSVLELDDAAIMQGGVEFEDAVSGDGTFQIGAAIIGSHALAINNDSGQFDNYDFTGATVVPYVGLQLSSSVETLKKGFYIVDEPTISGNIITLECLDNMCLFEKDFADAGISLPTTALVALQSICTYCGVSLGTYDFTNNDFEIPELSSYDGVTCLDMVSYIAQIAGCYARCDVNGDLELKWYDLTAFENEDSLDGGYFDNTEEFSYQSGDAADGGNFTDYNSGDNVNGGDFTSLKKYHHLYDFGSTPTVATDDVVITGIRVSDNAETPNTVLYGLEGYVLSIENNPLIQSAEAAQIIANAVGAKIVGMRFRPLSAGALSNPAMEAGDPILVSVRTNRGYNTYQSFITSLSYKVNSRESIKCDAETPSKNSAKSYSALTKTYIKARQDAANQLTGYDVEIQRLTRLMTYSLGLYKTEETLEDGSIVYYMHNRPLLPDSSTIWKMTADAFAVSTDGGETWNAGFDSEGNVIVNVLTANIIRAGKLLSTTGDTLIDLEYGVANSDNISFIDNIQSGFPLSMPFNIDDAVSKVNSVLLKFTQQPFRTDSTGTASNSSSVSTSSTQATAVVVQAAIFQPTTSAVTASTDSPHSHTVNVSHEHVLLDSGHSHSVTIPSHYHGISYGIYEQAISNYSFDVYVDDSESPVVSIENDSGNAQGIIDLTDYIAETGWHTIEIRSTTLKRISAQINIKSYIRS